MESVAELPIRSEWMYQIRSACQRFVCQTFQADRVDFRHALDGLRLALPAAGSLQEAEALTDRLKICAFEAGVEFHQQYHRRIARQRCLGSPVETALQVWAQYDPDPRVMLERWAEAFLSAFDVTHPCQPAEKAAAILRSRFSYPPDLDALAAEVGSSRSALTRDFQRYYGMSCGEYLTRVRLRWFIEEFRTPGSNAQHTAEEAGYISYHNLCDALRLRTGLTPTEIRRLTHNDARELVDSKLALSALSCQLSAVSQLRAVKS